MAAPPDEVMAAGGNGSLPPNVGGLSNCLVAQKVYLGLDTNTFDIPSPPNNGKIHFRYQNQANDLIILRQTFRARHNYVDLNTSNRVVSGCKLSGFQCTKCGQGRLYLCDLSFSVDSPPTNCTCPVVPKWDMTQFVNHEFQLQQDVLYRCQCLHQVLEMYPNHVPAAIRGSIGDDDVWDVRIHIVNKDTLIGTWIQCQANYYPLVGMGCYKHSVEYGFKEVDGKVKFPVFPNIDESNRARLMAVIHEENFSTEDVKVAIQIMRDRKNNSGQLHDMEEDTPTDAATTTASTALGTVSSDNPVAAPDVSNAASYSAAATAPHVHVANAASVGTNSAAQNAASVPPNSIVEVVNAATTVQDVSSVVLRPTLRPALMSPEAKVAALGTMVAELSPPNEKEGISFEARNFTLEQKLLGSNSYCKMDPHEQMEVLHKFQQLSVTEQSKLLHGLVPCFCPPVFF